MNAKSPRTVKVKVTKACNLYEEPKKVGDVVDADECTARNLVKKGWVELVEEAKPEKSKK